MHIKKVITTTMFMAMMMTSAVSAIGNNLSESPIASDEKCVVKVYGNDVSILVKRDTCDEAIKVAEAILDKIE